MKKWQGDIPSIRGKMSETTTEEFPAEMTAGLYSAVIPVGFATAVAMWTAGYVARLPFIEAPPALLFFVLIAILFLGGRIATSRYSQRIQAGVLCGCVAAILDLLVLGAFVVPDGESLSSNLWLSLGGSFLCFVLICIGLCVLGAISRGPGVSTRQQGLELMSGTSFLATLVLVGIGGLVTSTNSGLAVPDWPDSFGQNMFLLPLSRMTGGIYYEHAHRLYGALVGLVTGSLAIYLWRCAGRRYLTVLGFVALLMVILQGIAGGIRVTELSLELGVAHGVHGQMILALLAVIVTLTASGWQREPKGTVDRIDRWSSLILVLLLLSQLVLGALSRHFSRDWLIFHILGAFLILVLIVLVGVRGGLPAMPQTRSRIGISLVIGASLQIALGFAALAVTGAALQGALPSAPSGVLETLVATSHQTVGALMLSLAASLLCWAFRPRA